MLSLYGIVKTHTRAVDEAKIVALLHQHISHVLIAMSKGYPADFQLGDDRE